MKPIVQKIYDDLARTLAANLNKEIPDNIWTQTRNSLHTSMRHTITTASSLFRIFNGR